MTQDQMTPEQLKKMGERIRALRKARGYTLEKLGDMIGLSRIAVGYWERGRNSPSGINLSNLVSVLNTTDSYIFKGRECAPPSEDLFNYPVFDWKDIDFHENRHCAHKDLPISTSFSGGAFFLEMHDDSMQSLRGRSIAEGSFVLIVPSAKFVKKNDIVLIFHHGEYMIRVYSPEIYKTLYRPLNPQYPIIEHSDSIRVVGIAKITIANL